MSKIAIQGELGSFHEIAAKKYFGKDIELVCCETFPDVFKSLHDGFVDFALVAIGNSRYGDIGHVYDVLIRNHLRKEEVRYWIAGEVYIEINQCLLGVKGTSLDMVKEVHSQAPALGQCFEFLHNRLPDAIHIEQEDTAKSARLVSEWGDKTKVAIASEAAAELYGLKIIEQQIQDDKLNLTRFLVLSRQTVIDESSLDKTSILLKTVNQPGSLAKVLVLLSEHGINLSYLQSVPLPKQPFQFRFYIDLDAGAGDTSVKKVFENLTEMGCEIDILGSYKKATMPVSDK